MSGNDGPNTPEAAELEQLFRDLESPLHGYALKLVQRPDTAQDLVQEAFMRLHARFREVRQPRLWLYRTVHNLAMNHHRAAKKIVAIDFEGDGAGACSNAGGTAEDGRVDISTLAERIPPRRTGRKERGRRASETKGQGPGAAGAGVDPAQVRRRHVLQADERTHGAQRGLRRQHPAPRHPGTRPGHGTGRRAEVRGGCKTGNDLALKGRHNKARGETPGHAPIESIQPCKGGTITRRPSFQCLSRPFRAYGVHAFPPRALPWASLSRPFRPEFHQHRHAD